MLVSKPDEIKQSVWADRLKRYRVQMSYKQSALAEQIGVSQPQISRWENAYSAPSLPMQARIVRVLERAEAQEPWHDVVSFISRTAAVALGVSSAGQIRVASLGFAEAAGVPLSAIEGHSIEDVFSGDLVGTYRELGKAGAFRRGFSASSQDLEVVFGAVQGARGFLIRAEHWSTHDRDGQVLWAIMGAPKKREEAPPSTL